MGIQIPQRPLGDHSVEISSQEKRPFLEWSREDHASAYRNLQKTVAFWEDQNITKQHLVYGVYSPDSPSFSFQAIPAYPSANFITRFFRQFLILCKITFGSFTLSAAERERQTKQYQPLLDASTQIPNTTRDINTISDDAFCDRKVIEKQRVFEGERVNVLYNYAPIGLGGERLHFLITPKAHRGIFKNLTEEEYIEAQEHTQNLITTLLKTRTIVKVHFLHKSGKDAGQTVAHWHQHVIIQTTPLQGIMGGLTILKNMTLGSSPMKDTPLREKVEQLTSELEEKETLETA